jgi:outer membrane lipoprotein SlyB
MKMNTFALLIGTSAVVLTGCETPYGTPDRTATGALTGGAIGVASGALLGGRHSGEAALVGGMLGAVTGGLIGHSMDQEAQARLHQQAPQTYVRLDQGQPLSLADVKALAAAKLSDDVIVSQIRNSRTVFHLSSADIIDLKNSGVDEKVIDFMINTTSSMAGVAQTSQTVVAETPPPAPVETMVVPPDPGYVWVGGEWIWNGGWVWTAGHWIVPPYPHAVWIQGGWYRGPHGYRRVQGHWR